MAQAIADVADEMRSRIAEWRLTAPLSSIDKNKPFNALHSMGFEMEPEILIVCRLQGTKESHTLTNAMQQQQQQLNVLAVKPLAHTKQHFGYLKDDKSNNCNKKTNPNSNVYFARLVRGTPAIRRLCEFSPSHFEVLRARFSFEQNCRVKQTKSFFSSSRFPSLVGRKIIVKGV